ncbi:glutamate ABC transporter substrate-binding protein [Saccharomonospora sp. NPDC006951]
MRTLFGKAGVAALGLVVTLLAAGCGADDTAVPPARPAAAALPQPEGAGVVTEVPEADSQPDCGDPTASLRPRRGVPSPGRFASGSTMARIVADGKLIVGVDQNTYRFGFRDPLTGDIEGFDIDMARAIAEALFGDRDRVQLKVLTSEQRIPALRDGDVDIVIRTMTINCERLADVDFSTVYYQAGQRVLVKSNSGYTGMDSLGGKKVCATEGSTSLRNIAESPAGPVPVQVADWTDCLVMLQQNQVEAISTDDTILAGLTAQDPFTTVVGEPLHAEPYGIAFPKGHEDFVRFVNGVLDRMRSDGTWKALYDKWVAALLGPAPQPPSARYRD